VFDAMDLFAAYPDAALDHGTWVFAANIIFRHLLVLATAKNIWL
jgi:hypothetical protein